MDAIELLLHPVRLRIIHALAGGRARTTSDLCARLSNVSKATVYRHVALLLEGGLLEVAGEQRVHGAVERRYRVSPSRPTIDPERAAAMTLDEHREGFVAAVAALIAEFDGYLDREGANPAADRVGYRQLTLWLDDAEVDEMVREMTAILARPGANGPSPNRRLYLLSPILFPIEQRPASSRRGR